MNINWQMLFNQLAPGISGVNIALTVFGFMIFWPFGLFMLAYIFWGPSWGLDLRYTNTWMPALAQVGGKIGQFFRAGVDSMRQSGNQSNHSTGTPSMDAESRESFDQWRSREKRKLDMERARLDQERAEFEAEKRASTNRR